MPGKGMLRPVPVTSRMITRSLSARGTFNPKENKPVIYEREGRRPFYWIFQLSVKFDNYC